jgi:hypothetical protein
MILQTMWNTFFGEHLIKKILDVFVLLILNDSKKRFYKKLPHITNWPIKFLSKLSEDTWKALLLGEDGPWENAKMHLDAHSQSKTGASS